MPDNFALHLCTGAQVLEICHHESDCGLKIIELEGDAIG